MTNFIYQSYIKNNIVCDELIDFFNTSEYAIKNKGPGLVGNKNINSDFKSSTDLSIDIFMDANPIIQEYFFQLKNVADEYIKKYTWCNYYSPWQIVEKLNIQYYKPSEAFFGWHTERSNATSPSNNRHLVFMTYLNDVTDGGETEWYYQKMKVQPRKGLTVIWPSDWTHTHRGLPSFTQEKYIVTGWYSYV